MFATLEFSQFITNTIQEGGVIMKLLIKFNVFLIALFGISAAVFAYFVKHQTANVALQNVTHEAQLLLDQVIALRKYTVSEVSPLLRSDDLDGDFHAQSVPAYAATQVSNFFKEIRPEYNYKEAVFNPTNPRDNAAPWEEKIINQFINDESLDKLVGKRRINRSKVLYIAQPIKITDAACLVCHSVPEAAPPAMIEQYGPKRGFGWQLNEIIGIQMITVPFTLPDEIAAKTFKELMILVSVIFIVLLMLLNILFHVIVISPSRK